MDLGTQIILFILAKAALPTVVFGLPSGLIAHRKGFAPLRWVNPLGLICLVVVCCLPSAKTIGGDKVDYGKQQSADTWGAWLASISAVIVFFMLFSMLVAVGTQR